MEKKTNEPQGAALLEASAARMAAGQPLADRVRELEGGDLDGRRGPLDARALDVRAVSTTPAVAAAWPETERPPAAEPDAAVATRGHAVPSRTLAVATAADPDPFAGLLEAARAGGLVTATARFVPPAPPTEPTAPASAPGALHPHERIELAHGALSAGAALAMRMPHAMGAADPDPRVRLVVPDGGGRDCEIVGPESTLRRVLLAACALVDDEAAEEAELGAFGWRELADLRAQRERETMRADRAERERDEAKKARDEAKKARERDEAKKARDEAKKARDEAEKKVDEAKEEARRAWEAVEAVDLRLLAAREARDEATKKLEEAQQRRDEAEKKLEAVDLRRIEEAARVWEAVNGADLRLEEATKRLEAAQRKLEEVQRERDGLRRELRKAGLGWRVESVGKAADSDGNAADSREEVERVSVGGGYFRDARGGYWLVNPQRGWVPVEPDESRGLRAVLHGAPPTNEATKKLEAAERERDEAKTKLEAAERERDEAAAKLALERGEASGARWRHGARVLEVQRERDELRRERDEAQRELERLRGVFDPSAAVRVVVRNESDRAVEVGGVLPFYAPPAPVEAQFWTRDASGEALRRVASPAEAPLVGLDVAGRTLPASGEQGTREAREGADPCGSAACQPSGLVGDTEWAMKDKAHVGATEPKQARAEGYAGPVAAAWPDAPAGGAVFQTAQGTSKATPEGSTCSGEQGGRSGGRTPQANPGHPGEPAAPAPVWIPGSLLLRAYQVRGPALLAELGLAVLEVAAGSDDCALCSRQGPGVGEHAVSCPLFAVPGDTIADARQVADRWIEVERDLLDAERRRRAWCEACGWAGESTGPACPRCGAALSRLVGGAS